MNGNTTHTGLSQPLLRSGFIAETKEAAIGSTKAPLPKPTYAEVVRGISPPAQSLISMHTGQPPSVPVPRPTPPAYTGIDRAPALTKKCKDVIADAAKENSSEKKTDNKKPTSELALIFEKQNKPIVLSGGKKPDKQNDWFSDIKIVGGPTLPKKDKASANPKPQGGNQQQEANSKLPYKIIEVSPEHAPITYKLVEMAPKEKKKEKKTPDTTNDTKKKSDGTAKKTTNDAKKKEADANTKTGLGWATKKPLKKWEGDTAFNHPDVYLKRKPVGKVNPYNVLSGHGGWNHNLGYLIVPKGTSVTVFAKHGGSISDRLGNAIEHGDFDSLNKVFNKTFNSGKKMPNYVLSEPVGLNIEGQPTLTRQDVLLSELLEKNLGHVLWAACCSATGEKFSGYSFDVSGMHKR